MKRTVVKANALKWLAETNGVDIVITSLPDMEEIKKSLNDWQWFIELCCSRIVNALDPGGFAVFYQTDRKYKGGLIDKKHLIAKEFYRDGFSLAAHKIILKQKPGTISLFRPSYTNLFAFTRSGKVNKGPWPDVIEAGTMLYDNAMGYNACKLAIDMFAKKGDIIVDPFCGRGSVLKIANDLGFDSIGVDIDPKQVRAAKALK